MNLLMSISYTNSICNLSYVGIFLGYSVLQLLGCVLNASRQAQVYITENAIIHRVVNALRTILRLVRPQLRIEQMMDVGVETTD